jgi:hypothetical protein
MKKGRTTVPIHNYITISFNYVKAPALVVLACYAVVVMIELVWVEHKGTDCCGRSSYGFSASVVWPPQNSEIDAVGAARRGFAEWQRALRAISATSGWNDSDDALHRQRKPTPRCLGSP